MIYHRQRLFENRENGIFTILNIIPTSQFTISGVPYPNGKIELNNGAYTRINFSRSLITDGIKFEVDEYGPSELAGSSTWNIDNLDSSAVTSAIIYLTVGSPITSNNHPTGITQGNTQIQVFSCDVTDINGSGMLRLSSLDFSNSPQSITINSMAFGITCDTTNVNFGGQWSNAGFSFDYGGTL